MEAASAAPRIRRVESIRHEALNEKPLMIEWPHPVVPDPKTFEYKSDFDENGILYHIGTDGGKSEYKNPSTTGKVRVLASSKHSTSAPMNFITGRSVVRCVTNSLNDQWIQVDLLDKTAVINAYTLRHYASYDTEALRNWRLEASNDGYQWTILKKHIQDDSLKVAGGSHTWEVHCPRRFRLFRIYQFGLNSQKHYYLACSGLELYGELHYELVDPKEEEESEVVELEHERDFDENGLFNYLGTASRSEEWTNPADSEIIRVTSSSLDEKSDPISSLVDRNETVCLFTENRKRSWVQIDLKSRSIEPHAYTLRRSPTDRDDVPISWDLEGSNDGVKWSCISHKSTSIMGGAPHTTQLLVSPTNTWNLDCRKRFRLLRITQTGPNSGNTDVLAIGGFEVYGRLYPNVPSEEQMPTEGKTFAFDTDFDTNGLFYYLATDGHSTMYENPAVSNKVAVTSSRITLGSSSPHELFDRKPCSFVTTDERQSFVQIDIGANSLFKLTDYSLRFCNEMTSAGALRSWVLEGSSDNLIWEPISIHTNDESLLSTRRHAHTWQVSARRSYRYFRFFLTGPTSANDFSIALGGIEFYGHLFEKLKGTHLTYVSDFDENGVLYYLGSRAKTSTWVNPAALDVVGISSSELRYDSSDITTITGRDNANCVTVDMPDAWIKLDLGDNRLQPTHYTLRHFTDSNSDALRSWRLEASSNGSDWTTLLNHQKDGNLPEKGGSYTWSLPSVTKTFRLFRVICTGPNSSENYTLSCSGIELYGTLFENGGFDDDEGDDEMVESNVLTKKFQYSHDFDNNGIIHFLGTRLGTTPNHYTNPVDDGYIAVTSTKLTLNPPSEPIQSIFDKELVRCVCDHDDNNWVQIELKHHQVCATHYTLRHYKSWATEALRNWRFEGSVDGENWVTLREHHGDSSLNDVGATHTWPINQPRRKGYFKYFRVLQTGLNSNRNKFLCLSGFELYGHLTINLPSYGTVDTKCYPHQRTGKDYCLVRRIDYNLPLQMVSMHVSYFGHNGVPHPNVKASALKLPKNGSSAVQATSWEVASSNGSEVIGILYFSMAELITDAAYLLRFGSETDEFEWTPIFFFSPNELMREELHRAIESDDIRAVTKIVSSSVDVNDTDDSNVTPLMKASMSNKVEVVKLLVEAGADVNIQTKHKLNMPMGYSSIPLVQGMPEFALERISSSKGGEVEINGNVCRWKEKFPSIAPKKICLSSGRFYYEVQVLTDEIMQIGWAITEKHHPDGVVDGVGDDPYSWGFDGHREVLFDSGDVVSLKGSRWKAGDIVGTAIDLDARSMDFYVNGRHVGAPSFGFDIGTGVRPVVTLERRAAAKIILKESGFVWNRPSTALIDAAAAGCKEIVDVLINAGAEVNASTDLGENAASVAAENGHVEVVKSLVAAGAELYIAADAPHTNMPPGFSPLVKDEEKMPALLSVSKNESSLAIHRNTFMNLSGFPSVAPTGIEVQSGKHYCEMDLKTGGISQVGWGVTATHAPSGMYDGVGDDAVSWSFDGHRRVTFHKGIASDVDVPQWKSGDIVGMAVDLDENTMSFYLNGEKVCSPFSGFEPATGIRPVASVSGSGATISFRLKRKDFAPKLVFTPLMSAVRGGQEEMVRYLLETVKVDVSVRSSTNQTPLIIAASLPNVSITKLLLKAGADPNIMDAQGRTALVAAVSSNQVETVKTLIKGGAEVNPQQESHEYLILPDSVSAIDEANYCTVNKLELVLGSSKEVRLHFTWVRNSTSRGDQPSKSVLQPSTHTRPVQPTSVTVTSDDTKTMVGVMTFSSSKFASQVPLRANVFYKFRFGAGKNIASDSKSSSGDSKWVIKNGESKESEPQVYSSVPLFRYFVPMAAQVPLAVAVEQNFEEMTKALLENGADPNNIDVEGFTALHTACGLNKHGLVKVLIEAGADVNKTSYSSWTPLNLAAHRGLSESVSALLCFSSPAENLNLHTYNMRGEAAIHSAAIKGHPKVLELLIEAFKERGEDINYKTQQGLTALMCAARTGKADAVRVLMDAGADIYVADGLGWTARSLAADKHHKDVLKLLNTTAYRQSYELREVKRYRNGHARLQLAMYIDGDSKKNSHLVMLKWLDSREEYELEIKAMIDLSGPYFVRMLNHYQPLPDEEFDLLARPLSLEAKDDGTIDKRQEEVKMLLEANRRYCIVLEYGEMNLDTLLERSTKKLGDAFIGEILHDVAASLQSMHEKGYAHNNVQPRNIFRYKVSGENSYVWKIIDLQTARKVGFQVSGKFNPLYCSPEVCQQIAEKGTTVTSKSTNDTWSFGLVLYLLTSGQNFFRNTQNALNALTKPNWAVLINVRVGHVQEVHSEYARMLIMRCMRSEAKRPNMNEVYNEPYIQHRADNVALFFNKINSITQKIRSLASRTHDTVHMMYWRLLCGRLRQDVDTKLRDVFKTNKHSDMLKSFTKALDSADRAWKEVTASGTILGMNGLLSQATRLEELEELVYNCYTGLLQTCGFPVLKMIQETKGKYGRHVDDISSFNLFWYRYFGVHDLRITTESFTRALRTHLQHGSYQEDLHQPLFDSVLEVVVDKSLDREVDAEEWRTFLEVYGPIQDIYAKSKGMCVPVVTEKELHSRIVQKLDRIGPTSRIHVESEEESDGSESEDSVGEPEEMDGADGLARLFPHHGVVKAASWFTHMSVEECEKQLREFKTPYKFFVTTDPQKVYVFTLVFIDHDTNVCIKRGIEHVVASSLGKSRSKHISSSQNREKTLQPSVLRRKSRLHEELTLLFDQSESESEDEVEEDKEGNAANARVQRTSISHKLKQVRARKTGEDSDGDVRSGAAGEDDEQDRGGDKVDDAIVSSLGEAAPSSSSSSTSSSFSLYPSEKLYKIENDQKPYAYIFELVYNTVSRWEERQPSVWGSVRELLDADKSRWDGVDAITARFSDANTFTDEKRLRDLQSLFSILSTEELTMVSDAPIHDILSLQYDQREMEGSNFRYAKSSQGIVYYIGTRSRTEEWKNPCERSEVIVTSCQPPRGHTQSLMDILSRNPKLCNLSVKKANPDEDPSENNWIQIDFVSRSILPTHYTLTHCPWGPKPIENWKFLGSVDGRLWDTIKAHKNDKSFGDGISQRMAVWRVACTKRYRYFRIALTSTLGVESVCLSRFEIFGQMFSGPARIGNAEALEKMREYLQPPISKAVAKWKLDRDSVYAVMRRRRNVGRDSSRTRMEDIGDDNTLSEHQVRYFDEIMADRRERVQFFTAGGGRSLVHEVVLRALENNGWVELFDILHRLGVDMKRVNEAGDSPIFLAVKHGANVKSHYSSAVVDKLLSFGSYETSELLLLFETALEHGDPSVVNLLLTSTYIDMPGTLLQRQDQDYHSLLHTIAEVFRDTRVKNSADSGANILLGDIVSDELLGDEKDRFQSVDERWAHMFARYDMKKCGRLPVNSFIDILHSVYGKKPSVERQRVINRVLQQVDEDNSQDIDFQEFIHFMRIMDDHDRKALDQDRVNKEKAQSAIIKSIMTHLYPPPEEMLNYLKGADLETSLLSVSASKAQMAQVAAATHARGSSGGSDTSNSNVRATTPTHFFVPEEEKKRPYEDFDRLPSIIHFLPVGAQGGIGFPDAAGRHTPSPSHGSSGNKPEAGGESKDGRRIRFASNVSERGDEKHVEFPDLAGKFGGGKRIHDRSDLLIQQQLNMYLVARENFLEKRVGTESRTPLLSAIKNGNVALVEHLWRLGAQSNCSDANECTVMHYVAMYQDMWNVTMLRQLFAIADRLGKHIRVNVRNKKNQSPLYILLMTKMVDDAMRQRITQMILYLILERKASAISLVGQSLNSDKALEVLAPMIFDRMRYKQTERWAVLKHAVANGDVELVRLILHPGGAVPDAILPYMMNPMFDASEAHSSEGVGNTEGVEVPSIIHLAVQAKKKNIEVLNLLLEHRPDNSWFRGGDYEEAEPNEDEAHHLPHDTNSNYPGLLRNGSRFRTKDEIQHSFNSTFGLQHSGFSTGREVDQVLVQRDINAVDHKGRTALHLLCSYPQSTLYTTQAASALFKKKINIIQKDNSGFTALHYACLNNHLDIVDMLIAQHANLETYTGEDVFRVEKMDDDEVVIRQTALHISASQGHWQCSSSLVNAGAQVNVLDGDGNSPLALVLMERTKTKQVISQLDSILKSVPTLYDIPESEGNGERRDRSTSHASHMSLSQPGQQFGEWNLSDDDLSRGGADDEDVRLSILTNNQKEDGVMLKESPTEIEFVDVAKKPDNGNKRSTESYFASMMSMGFEGSGHLLPSKRELNSRLANLQLTTDILLNHGADITVAIESSSAVDLEDLFDIGAEWSEIQNRVTSVEKEMVVVMDMDPPSGATKHEREKFQAKKVAQQRVLRQQSDEVFMNRSNQIVIDYVFKKRVARGQMQSLFRYLVFLILITILGIYESTRDEKSAHFLDQALVNTLITDEIESSAVHRTFLTIDDKEEVWNWMRGPFMEVMYPSTEPTYWSGQNIMSRSGDGTTPQGGKYINEQTRLLGTPRLRQIRSKEERCDVKSEFSSFHRNCFDNMELFGTKEASEPFGFGLDGSSSFNWSSEEKLKGVWTWGRAGWYDGSGYVIDLDSNRTTVLETIDLLESVNWIDSRTRALFLEFSALNANENHFVVGTILIEFPAAGGVVPSWNFSIARVKRYLNDQDSVILGFEIAFLILLAYYFLIVAFKVFGKGILYFHSFFPVLDIFIIILFIAVIVIRCVVLSWEDEVDWNAVSTFVPLQKNAYWIRVEIDIISFGKFFFFLFLFFLLDLFLLVPLFVSLSLCVCLPLPFFPHFLPLTLFLDPPPSLS